MDILTGIDSVRARLRAEPAVALVPTMGNLHEGHLTLVRRAKQLAGCVAVSIFVNRLQFGANEDFGRYPRTFAADCDKLREAGADVVFAPDETELYPVPQQVLVEPPPIADELCGAFRPGHFKGMATVVLKLFNIVRPHVALFGKKDYQQLCIIRAMAEQLNVPVTVVGVDTVRGADGLALSSRNGYLTPEERQRATLLYRVLTGIRDAVQGGNRDFSALEQQGEKILDREGWRVDYVALRAAATLDPAGPEDREWVVLAAAWLGNTRLIDNIEFVSKPDSLL